MQGNIDGVIDYDPGETRNIGHLRDAIVQGITSIEEGTRQFVSKHPEIFEHYRRNIKRYLNPSDFISAINASSTLKTRVSPTEYPNVFGAAYRYLRYLGLRKRIKSTTTTQYGRLANTKIPEGELAQRLHRERRTAFLVWLQDPDKILYEDVLSKAWKNYVDKKAAVGDERGRLAQLIFGEPTRNYQLAKRELCLVTGLHLYNRWKGSARDNLSALIAHMDNEDANAYLLRPRDIKDVKGLLGAMSNTDNAFVGAVKSKFSYEGKRLFDAEYIEEKSADFLVGQLIAEFNLILESSSLYDSEKLAGENLSEFSRN